MILKLLVLVTITHVIRSESLLKKSTSKPNIPRDLQELLDSLYMTGYIPEYILPQDELTETEKTEGEYLDFPELKNAQDDVFVPPESEYSKNNLHYKNIKARKRLIPGKHEKIKRSGLQQEIIQPEISPEDLRSDLTAKVAENLTGCELKKNDSIKLDFLIPIPERGIYPHNNTINEASSSSEYHSLNEHHDTNESSSPIEQIGLRRTKRTSLTPTQAYTSKPNQHGASTFNGIGNTELTTCIDYATYEPCVSTMMSNGSRQTELNTETNNTESTVCYNVTTCVSSIPNNSRQTELDYRGPTISDSIVTYNVCVSAIPSNEDHNRQTGLYNAEQTKDNNSLTNDIYATANKSTDPMSTDTCSILSIDPLKNFRITQPWDTKNPNQQELMKSSDPQRMLKILNPQWPLNTPNPQLLHEIQSSQWPMNAPNPIGHMNTINPQGHMKIFIPPLNILNPPQWFMNMSASRRNFNKESTLSSISSQYSSTVTEQASIPKHSALNQNTKIQPLTFETVNPKNEKNIKRLQFTVALQFQPNVTIKPAFDQQIKNMLNIPKQSPPQQIINKKQPENRSRAPGLQIRNKKHPVPSSLRPTAKSMTYAQGDQTVKTKLGNSSTKVDLKTVDKNIVTNIVSLMADPLNINKMEAEVVKTDIKSSNSANNDMARNVKTYFDMESTNSSEIQSSQNNRNNKEQKYVNQNFINTSTERENVDSGKPKKKMFTFFNIFKKNKKYPASDATGQNSTTQVKRGIYENSYNELYRLLMEGNSMNDDYNYEYPIEHQVQEQEIFNDKRKKK